MTYVTLSAYRQTETYRGFVWGTFLIGTDINRESAGFIINRKYRGWYWGEL